MKKKNMIKLFKNVNKIKQLMVDRYSIADDECILRDLIESKTDVSAKDVEKMTDFILYLIENDSYFTKEIENEIVKNVKKILYIKDKVIMNSNDMLSILYDNNVLINNDDILSYRRNLIHNLEKDNGEWHSLVTIPCTSNLQKNLFIEIKLITSRKLELLLEDITDTIVDVITEIDIKITKIYIN